jgi:hypothetical protein
MVQYRGSVVQQFGVDGLADEGGDLRAHAVLHPQSDPWEGPVGSGARYHQALKEAHVQVKATARLLGMSPGQGTHKAYSGHL